MSNDRDIYLIKLELQGFKNISKKVSLSFYNDTINKASLLKQGNSVKAIYGTNGAGKSAIMIGLNVLRNILLNEQYLIQNNNELLDLINFETKQAYIKAIIALNHDSFHVYQYELSLGINNSNRVFIQDEKISSIMGNTINATPKLLLENTDGRLAVYDDNAPFYAPIMNRVQNLLQYQSMVSTIFNIYFGDKSLQKELKEKFNNDEPIIVMNGFARSFFVYLDVEDQNHDVWVKRRLRQNNIVDVFNQFVQNLNIPRYAKIVKKEDLPYFEEEIAGKTKFIKTFKPRLDDILIDKKLIQDGIYLCELYFKYGSTKIALEFESTGIKKLFELYSYIKFADDGGIVFIDELDSNIHDVYLSNLIAYFTLYGKGQLCFTTHDIRIMDVLKKQKHSIDFLNDNQELISWVKNSHYNPISLYVDGMIPGSPFNIDPYYYLPIFNTQHPDSNRG